MQLIRSVDAKGGSLIELSREIQRLPNMLFGRYRQHYEEIQARVCQLQAIAARRLDRAEFEAVFLQVEQAEGSLADGAEDLELKTRSYQTEINKQLRLLKIDLMFLKSARQAATTEQRWKLMDDRLHLLSVYCEALLSKDC
jgi:hypothetical protein